MEISFLDGLIGGCLTVIMALYGFLKTKGFKILPADLENKLKILENENSIILNNYRDLEADLYKALGNVSLLEAGNILKRGTELRTGGYTDAELQELGKMVMDVVNN